MAWPLIITGGFAALSRKASNASIVAGIVGGLTYMYKTKLGLFIMGAMVWLGINFASIKMVIEPAIDLLSGYANSGMGGGQYATTAIAWMGVLNFDRAITMIISAIVAVNVLMRGRLFLFKRGAGTP